jgi:hypothetical protein
MYAFSDNNNCWSWGDKEWFLTSTKCIDDALGTSTSCPSLREVDDDSELTFMSSCEVAFLDFSSEPLDMDWGVLGALSGTVPELGELENSRLTARSPGDDGRVLLPIFKS